MVDPGAQILSLGTLHLCITGICCLLPAFVLRVSKPASATVAPEWKEKPQEYQQSPWADFRAGPVAQAGVRTL